MWRESAELLEYSILASQVLAMVPSNLKALYRRGQVIQFFE